MLAEPSLGDRASGTHAQRRLREHIDNEGVNDKDKFASSIAPGATFREQAERWISSLPSRRRRPVKPATVFGWRHVLDRWVLPTLGNRQLSEVSNGAMRELIEAMNTGGLAPKTIVNYSLVPKMVLASVV